MDYLCRIWSYLALESSGDLPLNRKVDAIPGFSWLALMLHLAAQERRQRGALNGRSSLPNPHSVVSP